MHPIIKFFANCLVQNIHPRAIKYYICYRLEFYMPYSTVLFIDFMKLLRATLNLLPLDELAFSSLVKLRAGVIFKQNWWACLHFWKWYFQQLDPLDQLWKLSVFPPFVNTSKFHLLFLLLVPKFFSQSLPLTNLLDFCRLAWSSVSYKT